MRPVCWMEIKSSAERQRDQPTGGDPVLETAALWIVFGLLATGCLLAAWWKGML